ncbi:Rieske 2Fe-2S domain-containing protein [bacterium]|nr:Rieske 2Fe-2S domain-containing protein [bacterium]
MLTREQQETLTRVGAGTPAGELLRRYWHPVAASVELRAGTALPVRLLGEDLALFRAGDGALGLLDARCPHRGASLAHGVVDDCSLRCAYHGWRFDAAGACLEVPTLRGDAAGLRERARTRAYPTQELGGLIFAYLGPHPAPLLPRYDLFVWEGVLRDIGRALLPCNWLQIMENSVDPTHLEWLHGHHLGAARAAAGLPAPSRYGRRHEEIGFDLFAHGIIKRRRLAGGSRDDDDWRVGHPLVFPCMVRVGAQRQHRFQIRVPVDDTHTLHFWYSCYRPRDGATAPPQEAVPVYEVPFRDQRGAFLLDFVDGGDIMTWLTQGAIADRTREMLVDTDSGIVLLRRLLFEQIERVRAGEDPLGTVRAPAENHIIELPQERDKYGAGDTFLAESIAMSHVRYSPLRREILALLGLAAEG